MLVNESIESIQGMRTVLYLRLSKEDGDKEVSESIKNQELLLREYAKKNSLYIVDVYADDDYSGLYEDRPGFQQMIQDAYLGKFEVILSKSQSRFTRNMIHMEKYLHQIFPRIGVRFIGVVDGVDTGIKANKKARQIYALTNEWYCEDLSENIRAVLRKKMADGQYIGAYAPYGYEKSTFDHHQLVIDKDAAKVVQMIFKSFLEGKRIIDIINMLNDKHIATPLQHRNPKDEMYQYSRWGRSTIKRILSNEVYTGTLVQGTCERISYKDKGIRHLPKELWIKVPAHHEAIIPYDMFREVQMRRNKDKLTK